MDLNNIPKEYIEMCRKATEIQEVWKPRWCDIVWDNESNSSTGISVGQLKGFLTKLREEGTEIIWLPHQNQLQEMIDLSNYIDINFNCNTGVKGKKDLYRFKIQKYPNWSKPLFFKSESMEQLWLAFVMYEKYGKKWSNGEWILI